MYPEMYALIRKIGRQQCLLILFKFKKMKKEVFMRIFFSEMKKITERKQFWIILIFLTAIVFTDFWFTCENYQETLLSNIPSAFDLIVINSYYDGSIGMFFFRSFPFILIASLIGSDVFYSEKERGIHNYIFTRISAKKYIRYQVSAVMMVTFLTIVFVIIISQCLALMVFPVQGYMIEDKTAYNVLLTTPGYILSGLRATNPYLNNIIYAIIWGITGGMFSLFSYALSFIHQMKRYTILMIPMLLYLIYTIVMTLIAGRISNLWLSICLETNLLKVNSAGSGWVYVVIYAVIAGISFMLIQRGLRNDKELL